MPHTHARTDLLAQERYPLVIKFKLGMPQRLVSEDQEVVIRRDIIVDASVITMPFV